MEIKNSGIKKYPIMVSVPLSNRALISDVEEWAETLNMEAIIGPRSCFFVSKQDAIWFVLRWSN